MFPVDGQPTVSVVVLTYDRPDCLRRCLASLSQQEFHEPYEIVVADDGSGQRTAAVVIEAQVRDPRIRHVRHEHQGIPGTRNLGVRHARGAYVAIVADDHVLAPDYLNVARKYLDDRPEAAVVRFDILPLDRSWGARISHCYYHASILRRLEGEDIAPTAARDGCTTTTLEAAGAAMFRAEVLADVGEWDVALQRGEDTDQSNRLRAWGHQVHVLFAGTVRHTYRSVPVDTFRKCFLTGIYRVSLPQWSHPTGMPGAVRAAGRALGRARRGAETRRDVVWFFPWMIALETAVGSGYAWGRIKRWRGRARA